MIRSEAIVVLNNLRNYYNIRQGGEENAQALDFAISSLLTDEAYQLMYEGEEIFTKADMVAMLEELDLEVDELASHFADGRIVYRYQLHKLIQQKINSLEEYDGEEDD